MKATATAPATVGPRPATYELIERIVGLQLRQAPLDVLCEDVLPPLLESFGSTAGAVLLYHSDSRSLVLSASCGLSPAGRQHLAVIQSGPSSAWEIPMHGLLNRKAYIIERPHEHPFVPELIPREDATPLTNLALIPLYRGQLPVGVLLALAGRRAITNAEIMAHVLVYDVLALALDAGLRARGETPVAFSDEDLADARIDVDGWTDSSQAAQELQEQAAALAHERDALARRVAELEARDGDRDQVLALARAEAERRLQEVAEAGEERQRQIEAALVDRGANFESTVRKLQTAIEDRDALIAQRERELAEAGDERDRVRSAAVEAGYIIQRLNGEIESIKGELANADAAQRRELEQTRVLYEGRIEEAEAAATERVSALEASVAEALARAKDAEARGHMLAQQLEALHGEHAALAAESERVREALDRPEADVVAVVEELYARIADLEAELVTATADRAASERRIAIEAQTAESRLGAQQREIQELRTAHQHALEEIHTAHRREVDDLRGAHEQELASADAAHRAQLSALREELQTRVEQGRTDAQAQLATARAELQRLVQAAQAGQEEALTRATAAERRAEMLTGELERTRAEAARLLEERQHVLAAVDEPGAEPAEVIRGLREQVATLEAQVGGFAAERAAFGRRAAAEAHQTAAQIAGVREQTEATLEEARALVRARDAALAERERLVASITDERDRARQEAGEAAELMRRLQSEVRRVQAENDAVRTAHAELLARAADASGRAEALDGEVTALRSEVVRLHEEREQVLAAVEDVGSEPAAVIRALRDQTAELERRVDALGIERAALERRAASATAEAEQLRAAHRHEIEAATATHRRELEEVRATVVRLEAVAAQRTALDERLAAAEREVAAAERERLEQAARVAMLERDLSRSEAMLASATPPLAGESESEGAPAEGAGGREAATLAPAPPLVHVLEAPPPVIDAGACQVVERDPARREAIIAALEAAPLPPTIANPMLVNLLEAIPGRLPELEQAARAKVSVIGYAAEGARSRVLGPVHCFASPPTAEEALIAVEGGGSRRIVTLSDDVDGLLPARTAFTRAGHKVSMACDTKQALDLLGLITPDAVLVDLRSLPESAADFLGALALDGRVRLLLVYGAPDGGMLKRALERLLRPEPLDPPTLVTVAAAALGTPAPAPAAGRAPAAGAPKLRPIERPKPAPRKPFARRVVTKR